MHRAFRSHRVFSTVECFDAEVFGLCGVFCRMSISIASGVLVADVHT